MLNTRFRRIAVPFAFALAAVSLLLGGCAPSKQDQNELFVPASSSVGATGMYGVGESIKVEGIRLERADRPNGDELSVGYPSVIALPLLPEGVDVSDFRGGAFDAASKSAMEEQLGCDLGENEELSEGCAYVLVKETIENDTSNPMSFDVSRAQFVTVDDGGELSYVGMADPLWHDAWSGGSLKQYWIVSVAPKSSLEVQILYALPDDAIDSKGLAYLVDPGNANGEEGFVGLKAFDVAGQVQWQEQGTA